MLSNTKTNKYQWRYFGAIFLFIIFYLSPVFVFAQAPTLSVGLDTTQYGEIVYGGPAPLKDIAMVATVSGTATGPINYYFYCNAENTDSTVVIPGYAYSITGVDSTSITTPAGICDSVYATIGTYLAKVIVQRGGLAAEERRTVTVANPAPSVDLKIRKAGTTAWSDLIIDLPYNGIAEIRWTFSGATSCTMSGDWSGTKTEPGMESTGNLTVTKTYYYTLECDTSSGRLTDTVGAKVAPPTLFGSISANPGSGTAPLVGSILTANVTGGTALGTINYTFYCNRSDTGTNITSGYAYKLDATNLLSVSAPADSCNAVYSNAGTYTAKAIIERGGIATEARTTVIVNPPPPPTVDLTADSTSIDHNSSTTLRWTTTNATSCTSSGTWPAASKSVPTGSESTGNLTGPGNYTYTLTCTGPGGTRSDSVTISVGAPPLPPGVNLMVSYQAGPYLDGPITIPDRSVVTLKWETGYYGADSCEASGDWSGAKNPNGGWEVTNTLMGGTSLPGEQYIFIITCYNAGGSSSDRVIVNVLPEIPPPNVDLQVRKINGTYNTNGVNINYGESIELMWTVDTVGQTTCQGSGDWSGPLSPAGGTQIFNNLTSSKEYSITCSNLGGEDSDSVTVGVAAPPRPSVRVSARPAGQGNYSYGLIEIDYNTAADIRWEVSNATECEAEDAWSGPRSASGGVYTTARLTRYSRFSVVCYNAVGDWDVDAVDVVVGEAPVSGPIIFENPLRQGDLRAILDSLSGLIRMIAISLAAIMIIISGIIILTSIDDRERLNKGKNMLKWTLIGLAIALASSFIIGFIEELVG